MVSIDDGLLQTYIFYMSVLGVKMLVMSALTARQRMKKGVFANPEDAKTLKNGKVGVDQDVERVRRAHLNDLENIPVFMIVSFAYILSGPSVFLATMLFRIFTAARIMHTLVYAVVVVPQPARGIAFGAGLFVTLYMAVTLMMSHIGAF